VGALVECLWDEDDTWKTASSIVKTFAMQGLSDLARQHVKLQPMVVDLIQSLTRTGTPAMHARGRILLQQLIPEAAKAQRGSLPDR
jgi:hypothetical protein